MAAKAWHGLNERTSCCSAASGSVADAILAAVQSTVEGVNAPHSWSAQMREGAQNFQITQFGLSAFVWEPADHTGGPGEGSSGRYLAHTFNFWIFPRNIDDRWNRRFLSQVNPRHPARRIFRSEGRR